MRLKFLLRYRLITDNLIISTEKFEYFTNEDDLQEQLSYLQRKYKNYLDFLIYKLDNITYYYT